MKYNFIDPEIIMSVVVALIILAVGIFAFMITIENIPVDTWNNRDGVSQTGAVGDFNGTDYITGLSTTTVNVTTAWTLELYNATTLTWATIQAAGSVNGTYIDTNNSFRIEPGTNHYGGGAGIHQNTTWRINYIHAVTPSSSLENKSYNAILNASGTGDTVFNIVGIILIIGAIMSIIGLVYSYMKPRY